MTADMAFTGTRSKKHASILFSLNIPLHVISIWGYLWDCSAITHPVFAFGVFFFCLELICFLLLPYLISANVGHS